MRGAIIPESINTDHTDLEKSLCDVHPSYEALLVQNQILDPVAKALKSLDVSPIVGTLVLVSLCPPFQDKFTDLDFRDYLPIKQS